MNGFLGSKPNGGLRSPTINQKGKTMEKLASQTDTESYNKVVDKSKHSTGNKLKFKLEFMFMMLHAGRNEEAAKMYDQLIAEFDKLK
jgi:hypothetical protein